MTPHTHTGHGKGHVDYYVGTAVKLKTFAANTFDAIACVQVLCYVPKVHAAAAMLEMARVLKPGGRILILDTDWAARVIHTHDAERAARVLAIADADYGFADQHVPRKMPTLAKEAGLRVHDVQGFTLVKGKGGVHTHSPPTSTVVFGWLRPRQLRCLVGCDHVNCGVWLVGWLAGFPPFFGGLAQGF